MGIFHVDEKKICPFFKKRLSACSYSPREGARSYGSAIFVGSGFRVGLVIESRWRLPAGSSLRGPDHTYSQGRSTERPALRILTRTYFTSSTAALPVLAGVLPANYEVTRRSGEAGRVDAERENLTRTEIRVLRRCVKDKTVELGQKGWDETDEMHHVLWACPLYDDIRAEMIGGLEVLQTGLVYYADLVDSRVNFCNYREFARAWYRLRGGL
ncbi:hypothetical protein EVAR_16990_1 [Eumeta japonica]|uniref:Retrovirus-related Pol polyprotein from type-1 retrotransposable element R1 4 n=1 Tax=Eumeta variegata TaxID=151549 RepID=A0A4C1TVY3_EUMVA|nr:hypothetical protein EVAR_16990_1 [Eumeta japonica]